MDCAKLDYFELMGGFPRVHVANAFKMKRSVVKLVHSRHMKSAPVSVDNGAAAQAHGRHMGGLEENVQ